MPTSKEIEDALNGLDDISSSLIEIAELLWSSENCKMLEYGMDINFHVGILRDALNCPKYKKEEK